MADSNGGGDLIVSAVRLPRINTKIEAHKKSAKKSLA